jgi:hypothetical protein
MMEMRNAHEILIGKSDWQRSPGWKDNIKMDHREIRFLGVFYIHTAQDPMIL